MKIILLILSLFFIPSAHSQPKNLRDIGNIISADVIRTVVIQVSKDTMINGQPILLMGTGSFVLHNNNLYLVTATHVSKLMDNSAYILAHGSNGEAIEIPLNTIDTSGNIIWLDHPVADISVLKVRSDANMMNNLGHLAFSTEMIENKMIAPSMNTEVTLFGFPLGLGSTGRFSSLITRTRLTSDIFTYKRADTYQDCNFFALETPITQGYSGGPLIDVSIYSSRMGTITGGGTRIYGFAHGTISDATGGKIGLVTPSYYLFDILK